MTSLKVVLYTDGGAESPRGMGGSGIFGYTYTDTADAPIGKEQYPTTEGYYTLANKPEDVEWVQPIDYIEGYVAYPMVITNSVAELMAALYAMMIITDKQYTDIVIRPDSNYVLEGYTKYLDNWVAQGWVTSSGDTVSNQAIWERVLNYKKAFEERGVAIRWVKVAGHKNEYGNERADALATLGKEQAKLNQTIKHIEYIPAKELPRVTDKEIGVRHPLLSFPRWYFVNDGPCTRQDPDGGYYYYGGVHGKHHDQLAKPISESCHTVTRLVTPDPVMEYIRAKQFSIRKLPTPPIVIGNLNNMISGTAYKTLYRDNNLIMNPAAGTEDLYFNTKVELTHTLVHPRLGYRIVNALSHAEELLRQSIMDNLPPGYYKHDITDTFYEEQPPRKKQRTILRREITTATKIHMVDLPYIDRHGEVKSISSRLILGQDCPCRNALSAMAKLPGIEPKVWLISWLGDPTTLYFATVVACGDERSIWVGKPANFRLLPV